jgi:NADH:ubiquinone reductase (H+-translocating)
MKGRSEPIHHREYRSDRGRRRGLRRSARRLALTAKERKNPAVNLTLLDRHDHHQVITELPRVAGGTRAGNKVRIPLEDTVAKRAHFVLTEINGFDLAGRQLLTGAGPIGWWRLVLALGSRPNDFAIPGLAERTLSLYSADDAEQVWAAVNKALTAAASAKDPESQRRLATVVIGGGGATGVELAGELAEALPNAASRLGSATDLPAVVLVEAGPTILAGTSPQLIDKPPRSSLNWGSRSSPRRPSPPPPRRASSTKTANWCRAACSSGRAA